MLGCITGKHTVPALFCRQTLDAVLGSVNVVGLWKVQDVEMSPGVISDSWDRLRTFCSSSGKRYLV